MVKSSQQTIGRKTRLGKEVREYRKKRGIKQSDLQRELGVSGRGYLSKIETGLIGTPDASFLKALAKLLEKSEDDLLAWSREPEVPETVEGLLPSVAVERETFRLAFGHSLWGAPIFHAAYEDRIPEFTVTSFARRGLSGSIDLAAPVLITPGQVPESPGPESDDLAALSAADVLHLLKTNRADVGAIPGNIVPDDCVRIGTIVDSAAGCTFVTKTETVKKWKENSVEQTQAGEKQIQTRAEDKSRGIRGVSFETGLETGILAEMILGTKENSEQVRIGVEENTIAYEFLRDICQQSKRFVSNEATTRGLPLAVNDVKWPLRSSALATKSFNAFQEECRSADVPGELIGVIVWEPHATWMTMVEKDLEKIPIHFAPAELGRPHHLSYELVIRSTSMGRHPKAKELISAIRNLMFELWDSANRLNRLRDDSAEDMIEQISRYYRLQMRNETSDRDGKKRTLEAVGSILYSVRWDTKGLSMLM